LSKEGAKDEVGIGQPLNSALADPLGYDVARAAWPAWVDDLAPAIVLTSESDIALTIE
jgi:hypothetical protein